VKYQQASQVRLQERYRRLYKAHYRTYHNEAGYLISFIRKTPALRFIIEGVERFDLDVEAWKSEHLGRHNLSLPPTEIGRAKLAWFLLNRWALTQDSAAMFGHTLDMGANLPEGARLSTEQFVEPLIEYLQERLGEATDVLYLLERYVHRVEWFRKETLFEQYTADTARGEALYDTDLREFLFEQGIDFPFSQPKSASGQADIVSDLSSDDPLVCEVKLFDADSRNKAYVAQGFRQAVQYAADFAQTTAYLVVFNMSDTHLELPTDAEPGEWPPRIEHQGVTTFIVRIRAKPQLSASRQPKAKTVSISREDLVDESAI